MLAIVYSDGYKIDHRRQAPEEVYLVYNNWTPRKSRIPQITHVVDFGRQAFIKRFYLEEFGRDFFDVPVEQVEAQYARRINNYLGPNTVGTEHIRKLHKLGFIPLVIKGLPEGSRSPMRVPQTTTYNTHGKDFAWIPQYFETLFSCEVWGPSTSATLAYEYRLIFERWAEKTSDLKDFVLHQGHDFSMRGMYGVQAAMASGAAHLLTFRGTDTIPAVDYLEKYYGADSDKEYVGGGVAATEHAVMCTGTGFYVWSKYGGCWDYMGEAEFAVFKRLITELYPTGIISIVSDTWDLWLVLTDYMVRLKKEILARKGKVVIRPDSGDPADILCGLNSGKYKGQFSTEDEFYEFFKDGLKPYRKEEWKGVIELLWDTFGGTVNSKGYRQLDEHIGAIYGDSITLDRAEDICSRLADKGFASTNWVAGIGSFTYQYNTRDTFGFAMKATYAEAIAAPKDCVCSGPETCTCTEEVYQIEIFKDPITDDGTKKSARGLLQVVKDDKGEFVLEDRVTWEQEEDSYLELIFKDGVLLKEYTLAEIRERLWPTKK